MLPPNQLPGWVTALVMAPFAVMLAAWMFGLDEILAAPRRRRPRRFGLTDLNGREALTDPDGKPWRRAPSGSSRPARKSKAVENFGRGRATRVPLLPISQYKSL